MLELPGSSLQQRYGAREVYTLRCRTKDKPGMFAKVSAAIGDGGGHLWEVKITGLEADYKIRDIQVFVRGHKQLEKIVELVNSIKGVELVAVINAVLELHRRGSIETVSRVPIKSLTDLRMLYTPGVADVCLEVEREPNLAWEYTGICDRVAIVTNGTAVLGLGDIGPLAALAVMEGKAAILAEFVGVSGVPVLIDTREIDEFVETVVRIAGGYGAIQLEDVAAPACFEVEQKLKERLDIAVFHDDQHGTATIVLAALISALKMMAKKASDCSVVILGAGSAGIAISKMLLGYGFGDILLYDSTGAIYRGREKNMNRYKHEIAEVTNKDMEKGNLADGLKGKDIFIGVSRPNMVNREMISGMADGAIALPLSNPVGEISKEDALAAGAAVAADGRDINNAQAYPGIFRGALDARAKDITLSMKVAAAERIASLSPAESLLPDVLDRALHKEIAKAVSAAWDAEA